MNISFSWTWVVTNLANSLRDRYFSRRWVSTYVTSSSCNTLRGIAKQAADLYSAETYSVLLRRRRRTREWGYQRLCTRVCVYVYVCVCQHSKTKTTGRIVTKLGRWIVHDKFRSPILLEVKRLIVKVTGSISVSVCDYNYTDSFARGRRCNG